jgi:hypothetical protein
MRVLGVSIAPRAARCLLPGTPKAEGGGPSSSAGQPPLRDLRRPVPRRWWERLSVALRAPYAGYRRVIQRSARDGTGPSGGRLNTKLPMLPTRRRHSRRRLHRRELSGRYVE